MSRYYDILKKASRSSDPIGAAKPSEPETTEDSNFGISNPGNGHDTPLPHDLPHGDSASPWISVPKQTSLENPAAAVLDEMLAQSGSALHQDSESGPAVEQDSVRVKATTTLDRKAPVIAHASHPSALEHYRRLRTKLLQQNAIEPFRSLLIASAAPQEGKTITVINLAMSYAMLPSFKVLVVDGDFRRGGLGKCLGLDGRPGLGNLIDGSASEEEVVLDCAEVGFHVVVRGDSSAPAAELLQQERLHKQFLRWGEQFDLVLLDSSPLNLLTDTHLLAEHCDAVLLVARPFFTKQKLLEKALQDIRPRRVLGVVLNGALATPAYGRYSNYYSEPR